MIEPRTYIKQLVLTVAGLGVLLSTGHFYFLWQGVSNGTLAVWFSHGYGLSVSSAFLLLSWGLGSRLLRLPLLRDLDLQRPTRVVFALGLGLHAGSSFLLVLYLLGLRQGWPTLGWAILAGIFTVQELLLPIRGLREFTTAPDRDRVSVKAWCLLAVALALAMPYLFQIMLPNLDYDTVWYQLPNARQMLEKGVWLVDPAFSETAYPGAVQLLYSVFLAVGADIAIFPLNLAVSGFVVFGVFAFAEDLWGRRSAWFAALVCASINLLWELGLDARVENFQALAFLLTSHAFLRWEREPRQCGFLVLVGAFLGFALGIKYSTTIFVAALAPPILFLLVIMRKQADIRIRSAFLIGIACLILPSAFWYGRNAIQLGDPLYAFLRGNVYSSADGNTALLQPAVQDLMERLSYQDVIPSQPEKYRNRPLANLFNWWDVIRDKVVKARKPCHWVSPFPVLILLLPFVRRKKTSWLLVYLALSFYSVIAHKGHMIRYVLPILPLWAVGAGAVLAKPRWRVWTVSAGIVLCLFIAYNTRAEYRKLLFRNPWPYWSGAEDRLAWTERWGYNGDRAVVAMIRYVNQQIDSGVIDPEALFFMVGEGRCYDLEAGYLPDTSLRAERWLGELIRNEGDYERVRCSMWRRGVRYVVFNPVVFMIKTAEQRVGKPGPQQQFSLYHFLAFVKQKCRVIRKFDRRGTHIDLMELIPPDSDANRLDR